MQRQESRILLAPTDLSNFLNCQHCSKRDLDAAQGKCDRPVRYGPIIDALKERGKKHEISFLEHLQNQGFRIFKSDSSLKSSGTDCGATFSAMKDGYDVIYQPELSDDSWHGRADFLKKVPKPSLLGDWSYEVIDTKLASETKAGTILQLCVYTYLLEHLQGLRPDLMHVVTPGSGYEPQEYRTSDFSAYFRLLKYGITEFIEKTPETYPDMVSHCDICAWWEECEKKRRGDDHLCYVAGISKGQINSLRSQGIGTLTDLVKVAEITKPEKGALETLLKIKEQARIQHQGRSTEQPYYELIHPINEKHGLSLLPEPTADDIFLDFEGNHFAENGVQEYLIGYLLKFSEIIEYKALWAHTFEEEKHAFEIFIDTAIAIRTKNPGAHIYHYAPYEPVALKRLMGRYATRQQELDELLRAHAFVDLHTVVKRSLIASVERYSIKELEQFFDYSRKQDLHQASLSRRLIEYAIEANQFDDDFEEHRLIVENYNREDCESALRLRNWLEGIRTELVSQGNSILRPLPQDGEATETISELDKELQRLRDGLLEGLPIDEGERSEEEHAKFLLAHMMEFHRREEKASWWEYFRVLDLDESEYIDERRAITGLHFSEEISSGRAPLHRYRYFPDQELDVRKGDEIIDPEGNKIGKVEEVDLANATVDIKKRMDAAKLHPSSVVLFNHVSSTVLRESLMRFGDDILDQGFKDQEPYRAAIELLLRKPSPLVNEINSLQNPGEQTVDAACRLVTQLDGNVLAIQGPPGTGKTYAGGKIICALKQRGLKIGVTAVSHKVIVNLLESAQKEAAKAGSTINAAHKQSGTYQGDWNIRRLDSYPPILSGLKNGTIDVLGATAWCWSRPDFTQSVDVLIVDEAGQMSLSNVLAVAPAAKSLVLLGDPQQLEQPIQASHPEGSEVSALHHLLDGAETILPDKGLFLGETYRLHPSITEFTSEIYYQGRLKSRPGLEYQSILHPDEKFSGSGLRFFPVSHEGNQARSDEEVELIKSLIDELLSAGEWRDKNMQIHKLTEHDIRIVAPYNAQVSTLSSALPHMEDNIGTVDRFQGQEAPVVIYSMTSSSAEDAPRGMSFLYDPHRFNVATSRASAMCILVGNPALFEPLCRTPAQMKMANAFCRYFEFASS